MSRTVVRHRYIRTTAQTKGTVWDALHYLQQRPLGGQERLQDRTLFTAQHVGLTRQEARATLLASAGRRVAYHRLILSPGVEVTDLQRWTRLVLVDLARVTGQDLQWVAVAHRNTAHHHVHVLVGGTAPHRLSQGAADGPRLPVLLRPAEYAVLREAGDRWAQELSQEVQRYEELIRAEVELLAVVFAATRGEEGGQSRQHLASQHEQHGPPGRDATRGR